MLPSQIREKIFAKKTKKVALLNTVSTLSKISKKSAKSAKMNALYKAVKAEFLLSMAAKEEGGKGQKKNRKGLKKEN